MARIVTPGSSRFDDHGPYRARPFFVTDLVRRHGLRAVLAILIAALFAFAPLAALYWFNSLRLTPAVVTPAGQRAVVKPAQQHEEQEREEPGETALLQIRCEAPTADGWRELLGDRDPTRNDSDWRYVRQERVYLRRAGSSWVPFALLGPPPVSAWLPAGSYEILVVYEAPTGESRIDAPGKSYPLLTEFAECSLTSRQKTVCRIPLPHVDWGNPESLLGIGPPGEAVDCNPSLDELAPLLADCEAAAAIPTPAGYVLTLREPQVHHEVGHRGCIQDFHDLSSIPREWTRNQLATLRNWLPDDAAAAKARLTALVNQLEWREFLEGWFCYALAGVSGLVFTRWGAIALLEPWRRRNAWRELPGLLVWIFLLSAGAWFVLQLAFTPFGCQGPVPFRLR
jgi:hypothetical protein